MISALLTFAAEAHEEGDKTLFYVLGGALAVWAVAVSAIGISRHENFPPSQGAKAGVMAVTAVLVLATMASAALTS